jgi:tetratricopeptide (TPR) repeat protein
MNFMKISSTIAFMCLMAPAFAQSADSSQYFYQKGMEEKSAKRWLVASQYFDRALALNPKFTAAWLANGYANLSMRKTDLAKSDFTKVYELEPTNTDAIKELIDLYYSYHQYQYAIDFAKKCTSCNNNDRTIALCYFNLEDYASAEKILLKSVPRNPTDAIMTYTLGKTYMEMELNAKAIPYYVKAIQLDSNNATWLFELGLLYYSTDNFKNAAIYFNKAIDHGFPQSNDFKENLGYAYIYSGDFEKGEKLLLEVLSKKRGDKDILRDIAQVYYQKKMFDKSLEYCQKLMEMDKNDGKALYQAGLCFQMKGEKERGQQMCDRAIELDPSLRSLKKKLDGLGGGGGGL